MVLIFFTYLFCFECYQTGAQNTDVHFCFHSRRVGGFVVEMSALEKFRKVCFICQTLGYFNQGGTS